MAKLYFRYGAMGSAKTLNLLAVAHNYRAQGKRVVLVKPRLDVRFGADKIRTRAGLEAQADILVDVETVLEPEQFDGAACVLVDEAQFLPPKIVEDLRVLTSHPGVPVIAYGLKTDFRSRLFPGSQRLLELADSIEEIKTTCRRCDRKATQNVRLRGGDDVVQLGGDEDYGPACWTHYWIEQDV